MTRITDNEPKPSGGDFGEDDLFVAAYDKEGRSLGVLSLAEAASVIGDTATDIASISQFRDEGRPGRQFLIRIDESLLANAYVGRGGPVAGFEIYSLVFFIPKGLGGDPGATADASATRGIRKYDRAHAIAHFGPDAHQHLNAASNEFQVDLVDDDEGAAAYHIGVSDRTDAGPGVPGVATVHRIDDRVGFVESGPFDIRIILTEEAQGGFTKDSIDVANGSVTAFYVGTTLDGATAAGGNPPDRASELTREVIDYVDMMGGEGEGEFPAATGRDNKYHQYFATITPNAAFTGEVIVSIKAFEDNVKPVSGMYIPLTAEQRIAVTLDS